MNEDYFSEGRRYEVVAWAHGQKVLFYMEYGSYQGDWFLISHDEKTDTVFMYKDFFGSCSVCDHFYSYFGYGEEITPTKAKEFAEGYKFFLEIPMEQFRKYVLAGAQELRTILPRNRRNSWRDLPTPTRLAQDIIDVLNWK